MSYGIDGRELIVALLQYAAGGKVVFACPRFPCHVRVDLCSPDCAGRTAFQRRFFAREKMRVAYP